MTHAELRRMYRLVFVYLGLLVFAALCGTLSGCDGDCQSPFEKPDTTVQPVNCGVGCQS